MALDLFRLNKGIDIQLDDLSRNANILIGDGAPVGTTGDTATAPIGSVYMRTDAETDGLQFYWKKTSTNAATDWVQGVDKAYVDTIAAGLSWREPATVMDDTTYATIAAAVAAANVADTVDGVTIVAGDRLLFTDLTTGADNVYIVSGSTGAWIFTQDINTLTDGDALLVQSGTHAEEQWVYDGAQWVQFSGATGAVELGYLRAFMGKTGAGSEMPTYSSTEVVTQSSSLETAIGAVDAAFGTGEITNDGSNYALSDDMAWGAAGTLNVTTAIDELNEGIGNATFTSSGTNITSGDSANTSINNLNEALIVVQSQDLEISGVQAAATLTTMDTLAVASATHAKWLVQARSTGSTGDRRAVEVHAMTDGTSVDHTEFAVLKIGSAIPGFDVNVAISGTDLVLTINSTGGVDYVVKRIGYTAF